MANKRLAGPARFSNAAATLYTCPNAKAAVIKRLTVQNPTGGAVTFTLSIGADAAGTRIYENQSIPAGGRLDAYGPWNIDENEIVQGSASSAAVMVYELDGTESPIP